MNTWKSQEQLSHHLTLTYYSVRIDKNSKIIHLLLTIVPLSLLSVDDSLGLI